MASANLDLVRALYEARGHGDHRSIEWAAPEIECVFADGPSPGTWTGLAGMTEAWLDVVSAWDDYHHEVDEYRELDDGRILVLSRFGGRGKQSGVELTQLRTKGAALFDIRDGKVTRFVRYWDRERALADLDLRSER